MMAEGDITWYQYTRHHDFEQEVGPDDIELPRHHSHYSYLERIKDPMTVDDILAERSKTHGSFAANALVAQRIKEVFHGSPSWAKMTDEMRESLDLIALKLSRILTADPAYKDNWVDVGGYAQLVARSLD
jgi:hypothetical protein